MAKGFGGIPPNLQGIMKQAQKMQADVEKAKAEAETQIFDGSAGGGGVLVTLNGKQEIQSVKINADLVKDGDAEMLGDLVMLAVNDGIKKSKDAVASKLSAVTGGMLPPGLL